MHAHERIRVEMVEAEIESVFGLIDNVHEAHARGDREGAARMLESAEEVYADIESRVQRLNPPDRQSFDELVGEVRRELDAARAESDGSPA